MLSILVETEVKSVYKVSMNPYSSVIVVYKSAILTSLSFTLVDKAVIASVLV